MTLYYESTYACQSMFLMVNTVKPKYRSHLSDANLHDSFIIPTLKNLLAERSAIPCFQNFLLKIMCNYFQCFYAALFCYIQVLCNRFYMYFDIQVVCNVI